MIEIKNNAKLSEILVAYFLSEYYFHTKLIVGDSEKCPDIVSFDNSFSVEVVICELNSFHGYEALKRNHDWNVFPILQVNYDSSFEIVKNRFEEIISKKVQKCYKGYYSKAAIPIYLAIDSMMGIFDELDLYAIGTAIENLEKLQGLPFKSIIWLSRYGIYEKMQNNFRIVTKFEQSTYHEKVLLYEKLCGKNFDNYK